MLTLRFEHWKGPQSCATLCFNCQKHMVVPHPQCLVGAHTWKRGIAPMSNKTCSIKNIRSVFFKLCNFVLWGKNSSTVLLEETKDKSLVNRYCPTCWSWKCEKSIFVIFNLFFQCSASNNFCPFTWETTHSA